MAGAVVCTCGVAAGLMAGGVLDGADDDGVVAATGGCVDESGGGLEVGGVMTGTVDGETAGACPLAKTSRMPKQADR